MGRMARYGKEHKDLTRRRIIDAASKRFKQDGFDGSGVATLMADAGLTNGAFYAHFESKDDLVANVVDEELSRQAATFTDLAPGRAGLEEFVRDYLTSQAPRPSRHGLPVSSTSRRDRALLNQSQARVHLRREGDPRRDHGSPCPRTTRTRRVAPRSASTR